MGTKPTLLAPTGAQAQEEPAQVSTFKYTVNR